MKANTFAALAAAVLVAGLTTSCVPVVDEMMGPPCMTGPYYNGDYNGPTRHGNGPQTYIAGFPPPSGYDPKFRYGFGGYQ